MNPMSSVCSATRASTAPEFATTRRGNTIGYFDLNSPSACGSRNSAIVVLAPTSKGPPTCPVISLSRVSSSADIARMRSA